MDIGAFHQIAQVVTLGGVLRLLVIPKIKLDLTRKSPGVLLLAMSKKVIGQQLVHEWIRLFLRLLSFRVVLHIRAVPYSTKTK